jgi:hypothetical protein
VIKFNSKYQIEPFDRLKNEGFWRILLFRESKKTKQVMISVIVSKQDDTSKLDEIKEELKNSFKIGQIEGSDYSLQNLSIIYSDEINGGYKEGDKFDLVLGDSMYYTE